MELIGLIPHLCRRLLIQYGDVVIDVPCIILRTYRGQAAVFFMSRAKECVIPSFPFSSSLKRGNFAFWLRMLATSLAMPNMLRQSPLLGAVLMSRMVSFIQFISASFLPIFAFSGRMNMPLWSSERPSSFSEQS